MDTRCLARPVLGQIGSGPAIGRADRLAVDNRHTSS